MLASRRFETWAPWLLLLAVLLLWQAICSLFNVSEFIFPSPARIAEQFIEFKGEIAKHAWRTYWVTMLGFGIAIVVGVLLGFLIGSSRLAYAAIYPLMTGSNVARPVAMLTVMGKKLIRNAVSTAGPAPMPNHTTRIGTKAALGRALKPVING